MKFSRLTKKNQYEHIAEQIKRQIVGGGLKPGDKLPSTKQLAEQFGVGRSTTREALSALKAMGLIDIRQGGLSTVRTTTAEPTFEIPGLRNLRSNKDAILELLEARKALEVANAALAAANRTDDDLAYLAEVLSEMAAHTGEAEVGERTDLMFHMALAAATRNTVMKSLFATISAQTKKAIQETRRVEMFANPSVSRQLFLQHESIFAAVRRQDADLARTKMAEHLQHVEQILRKYLR